MQFDSNGKRKKCERCATKGFDCEGYDWSPPRNPAPAVEKNDSNAYASEPRASRTQSQYSSSRRQQSSTRGPRDGSNGSNRTVDYAIDNNQVYYQSSSTLNTGSTRLPREVPLTRYEPRSQMRAPFGGVSQQSPATTRDFGYNNMYANAGSSFDNPRDQTDAQPYTQRTMPYQGNQNQGWYQARPRDQRSSQYGRFAPY